MTKVADNDDPDFKSRARRIKEERSELVKHHLWVLWTDYFKPPHFEKYPELHGLFNEATKLAGASGAKGSLDADVAQKLLDKIAEIDKIFAGTSDLATSRCFRRNSAARRADSPLFPAVADTAPSRRTSVIPASADATITSGPGWRTIKAAAF